MCLLVLSSETEDIEQNGIYQLLDKYTLSRFLQKFSLYLQLYLTQSHLNTD